jgi:hypothetical protein
MPATANPWRKAAAMRVPYELILAGVKKHNPPCGGFTELHHRCEIAAGVISPSGSFWGDSIPDNSKAKEASPRRQAYHLSRGRSRRELAVKREEAINNFVVAIEGMIVRPLHV